MKKTLRRTISLLLVFCIAISVCTNVAIAEMFDVESLPDSETLVSIDKDHIPEPMQLQDVNKHGHIERLYGEETELNTAIFKNADGTKSLYVFDENIKYIDAEGKIADKSNFLTYTTNGYTNTRNDVKVVYPNSINNGISVEYGQYDILMRPIINDKKITTTEIIVPSTYEESDKISYENVYDDNINIIYTQTLSGFKEEIVLEEDNNMTEFPFIIETNGLKLTESETGLLLIDVSTNASIAYISPIEIWDSNNFNGTGSYEVQTIKENNMYLVVVNAEEYLANEDLIYPVTIDPSIIVGQTSTTSINDATIYTNYQTNFGTWMSVIVGNYDNLGVSQRGTARTFVKFPGLFTNSTFSSLYNNNQVLSVKYNFADVACNRGPCTINAYLSNVGWNESTIVYNGSLWNSALGGHIGSVTVAPISPTPIPHPRYELDITSAVNMWMDGSATNNGIILKAQDETTGPITIGSSESGVQSGRADSRPYVVVNYSVPSGAIGIRVLDTYGHPIPDAVVYVYRQKYTSPMYPLAPQITDSSGCALITGLSASQTYGVNIIANDYASTQKSVFVTTSDTDYVVTLQERQNMQLRDPVDGFSALSCWGHNNSTSCTSMCSSFDRICPHRYMYAYSPQNFGWRYGIGSKLEFHQGIDISWSGIGGAPVYNVFRDEAEVTFADYRSSIGHTVQLQCGDLYVTYMHLEYINEGISEGVSIPEGAIIGAVGNSGSMSTGTHLHFSVGHSDALYAENRTSGSNVATYDPVQIESFLDPLSYIN